MMGAIAGPDRLAPELFSVPESRMSLSRSGGVLAALVALALVATGCTIPVPSGSAGETTPVEQPEQAPVPATLTVTPKDGATDVAVVDGVSASVDNGTLTKVVLTNDAGKVIEGELARDGSEWKPAIPLGYGRTYTLAVTYEGPSGGPKTVKRSFTMANPSSVLTPILATSGGGTLESNREYGVGIVVAAKFDQPVVDRAAVEKHMHVTTEPAVEGNWFWLNDSTAHWRPKDYYATGTKVHVELDTNGQNLGGGQWGGESAEADFTIGQRRVAIADDATKTVTVYYDQKPVRTMPTSMGKGGYATYNGVSMHFWTQPGTYTVLDKASSVLMDSSTYGLPVTSTTGYKTNVSDAVRISNDGIYLHALAESVWAQGNTNVSHGCLNLSPANAKWYFDQAVAGDVVEVRGTEGPALQPWQNGDWSVPWSTWQKGSAG